MNKYDEEKLEKILDCEIDDIDISDEEIDIEWEKFKKLQGERNKSKKDQYKKVVCIVALIACMTLVLIDILDGDELLSLSGTSIGYNIDFQK